MPPTLALVGPGRVGCAVTARLHAAGHRVAAVIGRNHERAIEGCRFIGCSETLAGTDLTMAGRGQVILLAVPDDAIKPTAEALHREGCLSDEMTLVHFSGLHGSTILAGPDRTVRPALLSLHPLLPFADPHLALQQLARCPCALEGNERGLKMGRILINSLGTVSFNLSGRDKPAYHTAASIASNFLVTLVAEARSLLATCAIEQDKALALLGPLLRASLENVLSAGPEEGLTGPVVRGDAETVASHLQVLAERKPDAMALYCSLGRQTLTLAEASGRLEEAKAAILAEILGRCEGQSLPRR